MKSIKLDHFNTFIITIIILIFIIYYVMKYNEITENFSTYGYIACPPQFTKVGSTNNMYYNQGTIGIGIDTPSDRYKLHINGIVMNDGILYVNGGSVGNPNAHNLYTARTQNKMVPGSMAIGSIARNYGGLSGWSDGAQEGTAGLMLECKAHTEIAVHNNYCCVHSLMYYDSKKISIGRNMGWGEIQSITLHGSVTTPSDGRIKKNIQHISDNEMLEKVLLLQPVKYSYFNKKDDLVYGFIAQDVRKILGDEGTSLTTDFIYDINKYAVISGYIITFDGILEIETFYKFMNANDNMESVIYVEKKLTDTTYKVNPEKSSNIKDGNIYILGKKTDDFHLLNKDAIYTIGIGAIQKLHSIITKQQTLIDNLEKRLLELEREYIN